MLPRKNRINKDKEYKLVFNAGRASYDDLLGVKTASNKLEYSRIGIIVSYKTSRQAIVRNRLKRQLRVILKQEFDCIKSGYDVVIIAQTGIIGRKTGDIKIAAMRHFERLKLLK